MVAHSRRFEHTPKSWNHLVFTPFSVNVHPPRPIDLLKQQTTHPRPNSWRRWRVLALRWAAECRCFLVKICRTWCNYEFLLSNLHPTFEEGTAKHWLCKLIFFSWMSPLLGFHARFRLIQFFFQHICRTWCSRDCPNPWSHGTYISCSCSSLLIFWSRTLKLMQKGYGNDWNYIGNNHGTPW